jgi:hypothetical protein
LSLLAGLSVALAARQQIRRGAMQWREPYLPGLLIFELLVLLPLGGYFFYSHPGWSTLYFFPAREASSRIGVAMLLGSLIAAVVGYQIGQVLCRRRQDRALWAAVALSAGAVVLFFVLAGDRFARLAPDGDYENAPKLLKTSMGMTLSFVIPVVSGGWIFLLVLFGFEGRRILRARIGTVRSDAGFSSPAPQTAPMLGPAGMHAIRGAGTLGEQKPPVSKPSGLPPPSEKNSSGKNASKG